MSISVDAAAIVRLNYRDKSVSKLYELSSIINLNLPAHFVSHSLAECPYLR
jgi:hypothetical protein